MTEFFLLACLLACSSVVSRYRRRLCGRAVEGVSECGDDSAGSKFRGADADAGGTAGSAGCRVGRSMTKLETT